MLKVGLFIPCYVDQFYPDVAIATLELLQKLGCQVHYPLNQTCCGQPMANTGFNHYTRGCNKNFFENFADFEYIVAPSGSCVLHIKEHLAPGSGFEDTDNVKGRIFELTEFITDVLKLSATNSFFPYKVGLHVSCHGQRMLHLSSMSERMEPGFSKAETLLNNVRGLQLIKAKRWDECCGFGGTFCVTEDAVSVAMGSDRIREHEASEVEYIAAGDMSCLMHLEGILRRKNSLIKIVHFAQILNRQWTLS
ncbi:(Fe-S)-binding protein [Flavitalea antarctica]